MVFLKQKQLPEWGKRSWNVSRNNHKGTMHGAPWQCGLVCGTCFLCNSHALLIHTYTGTTTLKLNILSGVCFADQEIYPATFFAKQRKHMKTHDNWASWALVPTHTCQWATPGSCQHSQRTCHKYDETLLSMSVFRILTYLTCLAQNERWTLAAIVYFWSHFASLIHLYVHVSFISSLLEDLTCSSIRTVPLVSAVLCWKRAQDKKKAEVCLNMVRAFLVPIQSTKTRATSFFGVFSQKVFQSSAELRHFCNTELLSPHQHSCPSQPSWHWQEKWVVFAEQIPLWQGFGSQSSFPVENRAEDPMKLFENWTGTAVSRTTPEGTLHTAQVSPNQPSVHEQVNSVEFTLPSHIPPFLQGLEWHALFPTTEMTQVLTWKPPVQVHTHGAVFSGVQNWRTKALSESDFRSFAKSSEEKNSTDSLNILTTRWRRHQRDTCGVKWHQGFRNQEETVLTQQRFYEETTQDQHVVVSNKRKQNEFIPQCSVAQVRPSHTLRLRLCLSASALRVVPQTPRMPLDLTSVPQTLKKPNTWWCTARIEDVLFWNKQEENIVHHKKRINRSKTCSQLRQWSHHDCTETDEYPEWRSIQKQIRLSGRERSRTTSFNESDWICFAANTTTGSLTSTAIFLFCANTRSLTLFAWHVEQTGSRHV